VLTPYIPTATAWTKNAFFRKETGSEQFKIISGGVSTTVGARSLVPFIPLSKNLKFEYTRVPEIKYPIKIFDNTVDTKHPYNNSYTYTTEPGKFTIVPCDYVDDGFLLQNEQGQFISFNNGTTEPVWSPPKYSEEYNKCIFFIKPSNMDALMAQYRPSGEYFSSGKLVEYNSIYNKLNFTMSINSSYFTDYVTESRYKYIGLMLGNQNNWIPEYFQAPVYYTQLATVDTGLVITVSGGGSYIPGGAVS
jgi:hypothetical protein